MDRFLADAQNILETACAATDTDSELVILIGEENSIRIVEAGGVPLANLQHGFGARTAYRVTRTSSFVQVEGRSGSQSCMLQRKRFPAVVRDLLTPVVIPNRVLQAFLPEPDQDCAATLPAG